MVFQIMHKKCVSKNRGLKALTEVLVKQIVLNICTFHRIFTLATDHLEDESIQIDREGTFRFIFGEQRQHLLYCVHRGF